MTEISQTLQSLWITGTYRLIESLASNPAAAVSSIIMVNYSQYTAFMESRHPLVHITVINYLGTSNSVQSTIFSKRI